MIFDANTVWGTAVAVDKFQGGYFKEEEQHFDPVEDLWVITKSPNKFLVKKVLAGVEKSITVTDEDRKEGERLRNYFKGYLLKELSGDINDFEQTVLRIAQMEQFNHQSLLQFAIISCLPNSYRREQKYKEFRQEVIESTPLNGEVGDTIVGELIVVKCYYNKNYDKYRVTGRFGESFVDFWFNSKLDVDSTVKIKGKIKRRREDNTTQLNYVKKVKE